MFILQQIPVHLLAVLKFNVLFFIIVFFFKKVEGLSVVENGMKWGMTVISVVSDYQS